jgi:urease accessory protein
MIELAQTYLGNLVEDSSLAAKVTQARQQASCLDVSLSQSDRHKGRIQTRSTSGVTVGIIKSRDWSIRASDVFMTEAEQLVVIHLQEQKLLVLSFEQPVTASATELVRLGHVLGNHHYPITIANQKIYLQPGADFVIVEQIIKQLQIPGLTINYEMRSRSPKGLAPPGASVDGVQSPDSLDFAPQSHHH